MTFPTEHNPPCISGPFRTMEPTGRDTLRRVIRRAATHAAVPFERLCGPRGSDVFGILMYHRVCDQIPGIVTPTWNVSPARLRQQLEGLLSRGFEPWSLGNVLDSFANGDRIPRNAFVVTFDDGYANNFSHALPILQKLQIPATIFLATRYLDLPHAFPFDDWSAAGIDTVPPETWKPITSLDCDRMLDSGLIDLGCHTHTHQVFRDRAAAFRDDMEASLDVLSDRFGINTPTFSFPFGIATPELVVTARDLGLRCGLTTVNRMVDWNSSPFTWGRFHVGEHDTSATLAAKLGGWYEFLLQTGRWQRVSSSAEIPAPPAEVSGVGA